MTFITKFITKTLFLNKSELFTTSFSFRKADGGHPINIIADIDIVTSLQKITFQHNVISSIMWFPALTLTSVL